MAALFTALFSFITPVIVFFVSVVVIIAFLLGALADPQGWMNSVVDTTIDVIAAVLPSTPDNIKIGTIIESVISTAGTSMPLIGSGIIREVFTTISIIAGLSLIIKIYKLIPFKAT